MQPAQGDRPPSARKGVFPSSRGSGRGRQRGDCVLPRRRGPLRDALRPQTLRRFPGPRQAALGRAIKTRYNCKRRMGNEADVKDSGASVPRPGLPTLSPEGRKQTPSPEPRATHRDWRLKRRKAPRRPPARPPAALTPGSSVPFATSLVVCVHRLPKHHEHPTVNKG